MLRNTITGVVTTALVWSAADLPARAADQDNAAQAIIKKAIDAKGGEANLMKYPASTLKFKALLHINDMEVAMEGTAKQQSPDKGRVDASMKVGDQDVSFTQIYNAGKGWQGSKDMLEEMDMDALAEAREQFYQDHLAELRGLTAKDLKVVSLGESKVEDKPVVGLRVSSEGHRDVTLYFDKDSGLLLKSQAKGKDPMGGGEYNGETFYSDYKKVNGLQMAHKQRVLRDGKKYLEMEMTSITPAEKIDDKEFAKP